MFLPSNRELFHNEGKELSYFLTTKALLYYSSLAGKATANFTKFKLLMWKNVLIIWRRKFQTIAEILIPILFCSLLVYLRNVVSKDPALQTVEHFSLDVYRSNYGTDPKELRNLHFWRVWYAPSTPEVDRTMEYVQLCMVLNKIEAFPNPDKMIKDFIREETNRPLAAVIFNTSHFHNESKTLFNVTLRFPGELRDEVLDFTDKQESVMGQNWETNILMPPSRIGGPRNYWKSNGGSPPGYYSQKFITLQACLSRAYIDLFILGRNFNASEKGFDVEVVRYSHPPMYIDGMLEVFRIIVPMLIFMSFLYPALNNVEVSGERI